MNRNSENQPEENVVEAQYEIVCDIDRSCCYAHSDCSATFRYYASQNEALFDKCGCY